MFVCLFVCLLVIEFWGYNAVPRENNGPNSHCCVKKNGKPKSGFSCHKNTWVSTRSQYKPTQNFLKKIGVTGKDDDFELDPITFYKKVIKSSLISGSDAVPSTKKPVPNNHQLWAETN